jgi:hypothetical protein
MDAFAGPFGATVHDDQLLQHGATHHADLWG